MSNFWTYCHIPYCLRKTAPVRTAGRSCKKAGRGRIFAPVPGSSGESRLERLGIGALTMKRLTDKDATAAYSPAKGHPVVIYTCKFKPEHFRRGVEIVTKHFPE